MSRHPREDAPDDPVAVLAGALSASGDGGILVVTGAGVSAASGIPTFRGSDPNALWKQDVMELATRSFFESDPVTSWRWYLQRFDSAVEARPNPAHDALVGLERWQAARGRPFLLVTQNIDTLHEQAGSELLVKVHGSAAKVRCSRPGCRLAAPRGFLSRTEADLASFRALPDTATLPRCPLCGSLLRPHVLWFDEYYQEHEEYGIERVLAAAAEADTVLFAGTSFSVGVTALVLRAAEQNGAAVFSIDPSPPAFVPPGLRLLRAAAEELLPATLVRLVETTESETLP